MLIKNPEGKIELVVTPVRISYAYSPKHAIVSDGPAYWERMPTFDYYERRLQNALLKGKMQ